MVKIIVFCDCAQTDACPQGKSIRGNRCKIWMDIYKMPTLGFSHEIITKTQDEIANKSYDVKQDSTRQIAKALQSDKKFKPHDPINYPKHYIGKNGLEEIQVIEEFELDFHLGNVFKYIVRAGKKDGETAQTALEKARWYLSRKLQQLSS